MIRTLVRLVVVALALAAGATSWSVASASAVGPTKIRPHEFFGGVVNGKIENAVVKVVCPGAANMGRALRGQTLAVTSPGVVASNFGYTGSRGHAVAADVGPASAAAGTVLFTRYDDPQPFPTDIPVPCAGTGLVIFAPLPGSHGAKPASVTVSYANIAVGS